MRTYLDHNATTPLRPEVRAAMIDAMDVVGNPSSVHAEGRKAKALVEHARAQVADFVGCTPSQVVFTGSATEATATAIHAFRASAGYICSDGEHDAVLALRSSDLAFGLGPDGLIRFGEGFDFEALGPLGQAHAFAVQAANSETGVLQDVPGTLDYLRQRLPEHCRYLCDAVQAWGKMPLKFDDLRCDVALISAHKFGGPKGVGALILRKGLDDLEHAPLIVGGGQEMGRRSGTENLVGIAGFGVAAECAGRDVQGGAWDRVAELRNILENALEVHANKTIFVGKSAARLPNTSCILTPGWKGETQVMQMDLSGFAISAGSACSSGKVKASRALLAMGFSPEDAASAIRVSLGLGTTEEEVLRFADAWGAKLKKHQSRAA
ncbi:cysteine desulfurase [Aliishimia ponticola]|uniref:Cysteine desulfurase n=1 Tax=Aliishimia ponticola TaxID=2499833 RepID=A0A4S4NG07_9RHOB|nr:cysteine desulfurase family protein [Aliishimia ponticola]THH38562.1 cysteine desulfurase [Aliishimia ponticola]